MRQAFAARGSLSIMLNTSFGGSDVDSDNGASCKAGGCCDYSDCRESIDCAESGNCWEFGDCGWPGGGETGVVGEAGDGGEPGSRSTLKTKLPRLVCCLEDRL